MKPEDLLWKVLRATTNSPNDIWKDSHYSRHKGLSKKLLNNLKRRYTVPIKHVTKTEYGDIYLVIQFSTDRLDFPYFVIPSIAFTKDLKTKQEFVYAINVRLCFDYEFKIKNKNQLKKNGSVKEEYRRQILMNSLGLIRNRPRWKVLMDFIDNKRYTNLSKKQLENVIKITQFNNEERIFKGLEKEAEK